MNLFKSLFQKSSKSGKGGGPSRLCPPLRINVSVSSKLSVSSILSSGSASTNTPVSSTPMEIETDDTDDVVVEPTSWCRNQFSVGRALGKGKFGNVYLATQQATATNVALKVLFKSSIVKGGKLAIFQLRREVEIQSRMTHQNICRLFGFFVDESHAYLVLEYCANGMLYKLLKKEKAFDEKRTVQYALDIARALEYCHARHVIHRDIKLENLLLDGNGVVKLADFGWSVHVPPGTPEGSARRTTLCGTPEYLSPEIVAGMPHGTKTDLWSFGVLIYEFLHGTTPFYEKHESEMFDRILSCDLQWGTVGVSPRVSQGARMFIEKLLRLEPMDRFTAKQAVRALEKFKLRNDQQG